MEVTNFQKDVIERSAQVPVVVDFWAAWCGPCRILGPVIEELAQEAAGKWELAKVDTEVHQEAAAQYGIQSIPAVKMFYQGEVIAEFVGALPKYQIQQWLDQSFPNERKQQLEMIATKLDESNGRNPEALQELKQFVQDNPDIAEARLLLAWETVFDDPEAGKSWIADFQPGHQLAGQAEDIRSIADLMECAEVGSDQLMEKLEGARSALKQQDMEAALKHLIGAVGLDKNFCQEMPRRATVALFHFLGDDHELNRKYRRQFSMALY